MTATLAYPGDIGGVDPSAERSEILAGQAHNFGRQLLVIGAVQAVNAGFLGGVFYAYVNPYLLSAWIVAVWYLAFFCVRTWWRYRDRIDETAPKPGYIERAIRSTYVSGILWGVGAALLFVPESIPHQLFLVFLIGGMAAGTTAGLSTLPNAWIGVVDVIAVSVRLLTWVGLDRACLRAANSTSRLAPQLTRLHSVADRWAAGLVGQPRRLMGDW